MCSYLWRAYGSVFNSSSKVTVIAWLMFVWPSTNSSSDQASVTSYLWKARVKNESRTLGELTNWDRGTSCWTSKEWEHVLYSLTSCSWKQRRMCYSFIGGHSPKTLHAAELKRERQKERTRNLKMHLRENLREHLISPELVGSHMSLNHITSCCFWHTAGAERFYRPNISWTVSLQQTN